jgi:hypothetical protein
MEMFCKMVEKRVADNEIARHTDDRRHDRALVPQTFDQSRFRNTRKCELMDTKYPTSVAIECGSNFHRHLPVCLVTMERPARFTGP